MRTLFSSTTLILFLTIPLCLSGCRSVMWWKEDAPKPQQNAILTNETEVAGFNGFRTIDASMMEPSAESKKDKSFLWDNSEARAIERRLGVQN